MENLNCVNGLVEEMNPDFRLIIHCRALPREDGNRHSQKLSLMNCRPIPFLVLFLLSLARSHGAAVPLAETESAKEPVIYTGALQPDGTYYDSRLPHALGVHSIQAFRANRANPPNGGVVGFTYNHQPYLAYW